jgi:signal transduction histidine kinase
MKAPTPRRKFYRFRTRMIAIMVVTMIVTVAVLVGLHSLNTGVISQHVVETTNELLNIIQIAETKIPSADTPQEAIKRYMEELTSHGVTGVKIVDASGENAIIASTNPMEVGKKIQPKKGARKKAPFKIYGRVGDEDDTITQEPYKITFPVIQGEEVIGYTMLDMPLDDFRKLLNQIYFERILATLGVLFVGCAAIVYLAFRFTRPIDDVVEAARQVASGNLDFSIPIKSSDEIGTLASTFNEMIEKLRETRQLEERLYQVEKQSTVGRLAAGIAHEIRNPLNYINLSIDHVKTKFLPPNPEEGEDFRKTLDNIKDEISRLKRMVNEFLEFSKPTKLLVGSWSLHSIVRDVLKLLEGKIEDQQIQLNVELPTEESFIAVDREQIRTCFLNIMINSIESMPTGGTLSISAVENFDVKRLNVTVADTGSGIAENVQANVFEPYFSTKETGIGLGLAITKKIIQDHGGKIRLESALNRGTKIFLELPLATESELVPMRS